MSQGSGLVRPYIDAAVLFEAKSPSGQGFFFADPYGYMYATPNAMLEFTGFTEGSFYDPSGGVSNPMVVKNYAEASDFALELLEESGVEAENVEVKERPDLLMGGNPLVTEQSAAELTFEYESDGKEIESSVVVRTVLIEISGTGIWYASVMEYYAPAELMNKTELLVLNMQRSFKVDEEWAAREQIEVQKRMGILAQSQNEISDIISSTFEMRSQTLDELNKKWDEYILGIENVYNPETGEHYIVDSGSNYYWVNDIGTIYGTDIDENPLPNENLVQLQCPNC
ncbi:hypothetical protein KAW38_01930 [Candidatus Micrarchaeota archaeon]|nr:hypothetical protein [Candidatus Micrarchaeota archaeon]